MKDLLYNIEGQYRDKLQHCLEAIEEPITVKEFLDLGFNNSYIYLDGTYNLGYKYYDYDYNTSQYLDTTSYSSDFSLNESQLNTFVIYSDMEHDSDGFRVVYVKLVNENDINKFIDENGIVI